MHSGQHSGRRAAQRTKLRQRQWQRKGCLRLAPRLLSKLRRLPLYLHRGYRASGRDAEQRLRCWSRHSSTAPLILLHAQALPAVAVAAAAPALQLLKLLHNNMSRCHVRKSWPLNVSLDQLSDR